MHRTLCFVLVLSACSGTKNPQCAKSTFDPSSLTCMSDSDCCDGWSCIDHARNDGKLECGVACTTNADCSAATKVRKYCNKYSWGTICDSVPPGIAGGSGGGSASGDCCGDGFCCPMGVGLCCGSPALGTTGVCCPHGLSRGVGTCDLDPPCYSGDAEARQHCSGVSYQGQIVYSELCGG